MSPLKPCPNPKCGSTVVNFWVEPDANDNDSQSVKCRSCGLGKRMTGTIKAIADTREAIRKELA